MGGRLTSPTSSSSTATAHRASTSTSTNSLAHSRTHSANGNHSVSNQTSTSHHRHRSNSSSHHRSHHRHNHHHHHPVHGSMHGVHNGRARATSTNADSLTTTPFNLNLLRYVGLNHDTDDPSSEDESPRSSHHHFPRFLLAIRDLPCPVCNKTIPSDSFDKHILNCLSKPRIDYNEDTLTEDKGECAICLDDLVVGNKIARLPCLCIYHKSCIDNWFRINRTCPEHPGD